MTKVIFDREFSDLGVQFFDFDLFAIGLQNFVRKRPRQTVNRLSLLRYHMDFVLGLSLLLRLLLRQRLTCKRGLKTVRKPACLRQSFILPSLSDGY